MLCFIQGVSEKIVYDQEGAVKICYNKNKIKHFHIVDNIKNYRILHKILKKTCIKNQTNFDITQHV